MSEVKPLVSGWSSVPLRSKGDFYEVDFLAIQFGKQVINLKNNRDFVRC